MNDTMLTGPCADYERDLVELSEDGLPPERARIVRLHVAQCARCRAWQADFAALDARLATALPRPALSADFARKLQARLDTLSRPAARGDLRTVIEREHDSLLDALRSTATRRAVSGAVGSALATVCALVTARGLLASGLDWLSPLVAGIGPLGALGAIGVAIALAALAWASRGGSVPLVGTWR